MKDGPREAEQVAQKCGSRTVPETNAKGDRVSIAPREIPMPVIFSQVDIDVQGHKATLLELTIAGDGNLSPDELPGVIDQIDGKIDGTKGVVISGRGPVWLYGALLHHLHVTRWAATFDPRQGAVVVSRHHPDAPAVGESLELPKSA